MAKFEVQARVLDLLGFQQIANCPTAISELFKNAWDAYAEKVMLDVYPDKDQAVLWDDGIGMTEDEVLHRWLVVGAAGKQDLRVSVDPPVGMLPRPIQGEKGIGRLAISTLGDTLLLISRSRTPKNVEEPFVALLINWNIVQNEHLRLSDLEIPSITFADIEDLESGIVADMARDLRLALLSSDQAYAWDKVLDAKKREQACGLRRHILNQLEGFAIDISVLKRTVQESGGRHGTIFCIGNLKKEFHQYVHRPRRDEGEQDPHNELVQLLSNFRNTFDDEANAGIDFEANIRRWNSQNSLLTGLFQETAAFEPADLRLYDHHIDVEFDDTGRFDGVLEIYGKPVDLPPREAQVQLAAQCGPFRLHLWYYQDKNDSLLNAEQWSLINKKLVNFGGLMIYRDGLRVLPYGRPEFDWLRMEERRSKGAGYYFFSYRRLFGYVEITRRDNPQLIDKSGREGLIVNSAYRNFRQILEDFFIYLAREYFKKDAPFHLRKEEISAERKKVEQERKRAAELRKGLREQATEKLRFMRDKAPEFVEQAYDEATERLDAKGLSDVRGVADTLLRFENRIAQILGMARLSVPRNLSITRDRELRRLKHDHDIAFEVFSSQCDDTRRRFQAYVEMKSPEARSTASQQRAIEQAYAQALAQIGKAHGALRAELDEQTKRISANADEIYSQLRTRVDKVLLSATGTATIEAARAAEIASASEVLGALSKVANNSVETLQALRERLADQLGNCFGESKDQLIAAQTSEIDELRERVDQNLELVQLGLAVEIIDHDLSKLFLGIRSSLARLQNLLRSTPKASRHLDDLRSSFQHLEQRFRQMSPIYRGSYRLKTEIDGKRILAYCKDFLGHQLRSVGVELESTEMFRTFRIVEVEAVILPVFVNIIDNAIYWLRDSEERRILLDRRGQIVTICDTGPGMHSTTLEEIFEPFVSGKPGGRGLGLYIARANLERYGHEIWATNDPEYRALQGACFCIRFHEDVIGTE